MLRPLKRTRGAPICDIGPVRGYLASVSAMRLRRPAMVLKSPPRADSTSASWDSDSRRRRSARFRQAGP